MSINKKTRTRFVKPLSKGQITIPIAFRKQLGITENTILGIVLKEGKIEISPLRPVEQEKTLREYSDAEIRQFLKEDRIAPQTAARVRRLLGKKIAS